MIWNPTYEAHRFQYVNHFFNIHVKFKHFTCGKRMNKIIELDYNV